MALLLKTLGALTAVVLLVATLLGSLLTLGGFLLVAIKVLIIVVFVAILTLVIVSILRGRSQRRRASEDF
jgi:membrane protein YdbS with pleckstrin-like domain